MILLAVIVSAHGIQGAVKIKTFTQSPENIFAYGALQDEKKRQYSLKLLRVVSPSSLIATVKGVHNRTDAEALRGVNLYVERSQLPGLVDEEFYHNDLIGLMVQDLEEQEIGLVKSVLNFGAGDFLEIIGADGHLYTISFTREAVPRIHLPKKGKAGIVQVNRQFLLGVELPAHQPTPPVTS
jgi:16S rRNA processing protein RimM